MKELGKQVKCQLHTLPIIKIELQTKRLFCEKCLSENDEERRQRLQLMRVRLSKNYQVNLQQLKQLKQQTDRLLDLFQSKNMVQAKRIINKASNDAQKIVQSIFDKEIKEANKQLKQAAEAQLEKWKIIDNKIFCPAFLQFEEQQPRIEQKLLQFKQSLKLKIAEKIKQELRVFYSNLFEF